MDKTLYTLIVHSENIAGLLNQITAVFTRRQINIESLNVSASSIKGVHKYTITVWTTKDIIEKVVKQIEKKIDVLQAHYFTDDEIFLHEIALYKVSIPEFQSNPIASKVIRRYNARIVEVNPVFAIVEKAGMTEEITSLYEELQEAAATRAAESSTRRARLRLFGCVVEVVTGQFTTYGCRIRLLQHLVIALNGRLDVRARDADEVAVGYGGLGDGRAARNLVFFYKRRRGLGVGGYGFDGLSVLLQKRRDSFGVLLGECFLHDDAAHGQNTAVVERVPLLGQVERNAHVGVFHQHARHIRHGQHADVDLARSHQGGDLIRVPEFNRYILARRKAVFTQQVVEHIFGVCALAVGVDGLSPQVGHLLDAVAVFQDIEHALGVERQELDVAAGLAVEGRGRIRRERGDVHFARGYAADHVGRRGGEGEGVIVFGLVPVALVPELNGADAGRALDEADAHRRLFHGFGLGLAFGLGRRALALRLGSVPAAAGREQAAAQGQQHEYGQDFLHVFHGGFLH